MNDSSSTSVDARQNLRLPLPRLAEISFSTSDSIIAVLSDEALFEACGTRIAFTQRSGGVSGAPYDSFNLSASVGDELDNVHSNRNALCTAFDSYIYAENLIIPHQIHGDLVIETDDVSETQAKAKEGADGVICSKVDTPVLLCFADCVPVILVAPGGGFAVLHSGWRGTIASIAGKGLSMLSASTGYAPSEVNCYIGPHIGPCCYEVSDELMERFREEFGDACDGGHDHLDLSAAVTIALERAGASAQRIVATQDCTSCRHDLYYSYRADHGVTGRHGAFAIRKVAS